MNALGILRVINALVAFFKLLTGLREKVDEHTVEQERGKAEALDKEELDAEVNKWTRKS